MNEPFETLTRHRIAFEGLHPLVVVPLAAVLAWVLWRLYRRELARLDARSRRVIRILRVAAVVLFVAALANPTWERIEVEYHKPLVAVAVDTSRSMELADAAQRGEELVRLALALGVLDRSERSSGAEQAAQVLRSARRELSRSAADLRAAYFRAYHAVGEKATAARVAEAVDAAGATLQRLASPLNEALAHAASVESELGFDPALVRQAGDARLDLDRLARVVVKGFLPDLYARAKDFSAARQDVFEVEEALAETDDTIELVADLAGRFDLLQDAADRRLLETADADTRRQVQDLARLKRREVIEQYLSLSDGLLDTLRENYRLRLYSINDTAEVLPVRAEGPLAWSAGGSGTDLGGGLRGLAETISYENLAGVVLFSDGRHTEGEPPQLAARNVKSLGVPLHVVGVGSASEPTDVAIVNVQAPEALFKTEQLAPRAFVRARGYGGSEIKAALRLDGKEIERLSEKVQAGGEMVELAFSPMRLELGEHRFELTVDPQPGEEVLANNRLEFTVRVTDRRQKVLLLEGLPRWQAIELSAAVRANPNVEVREVIWGTQPERRMEIDEGFRQVLGKGRRLRRGPEAGEFPESRQALLEFDVVFLGDFPVTELTYEEQKALADFVQYRGGSLVLCAGPRFNPYQYEDSALGGLLPVALPLLESDTAHLAFRPYHQDGYGLRLTPAGRGSPLCRLVPGQQANIEVWGRLPRSFWRFPQLEAQPGTTVLAESAGEDEGGEPLIVARQVGLGRVLYVGLDDVWRWKAADGEFAGRFWSNVVRWAVAGGISGRRQNIGLATSRRRYGAGEPVIVGAHVVDDDNYGVDNDVLSASVVPEGAAAGAPAVAQVRLEPLAGSPGLYQGAFTALGEGRYALRVQSALYARQAAALNDVVFSVGRDSFLEHLELGLNRELLEAVAGEGGGQYFSIDRADNIAEALPEGARRESTRRVPNSLWDNYAYLLILVGLLGGEWVWRKLRGLL